MKGDHMATDPANPSPRELPLSNQTRFSAQLAAAPDEVAALKASRDQLIAERDEVQAQLSAAREEVAMLQRQLEEGQAKASEAGSIRRSAPTQAKKARR